ncbi:MAG TPA: hypothetical protein PK163_02165, partial [Steroidobacteraceae bacterium]|nr:hypothetical protein [Steroidobacteraceae bacterium]
MITMSETSKRTSLLFRAIIVFIVLATIASGLWPAFVAQAAPGDENWDDRFPPPGVVNSVLSFAFDGGGNLYVGGSLATVGGMSASGIARWNGRSWSTLGSGVNGAVYALALDHSGNLYVGGSITVAGDVPANYV